MLEAIAAAESAVTIVAKDSTCDSTRSLHHHTPPPLRRSDSANRHPSSYCLASLGLQSSEASLLRKQVARSNPHDTQYHRQYF